MVTVGPFSVEIQGIWDINTGNINSKSKEYMGHQYRQYQLQKQGIWDMNTGNNNSKSKEYGTLIQATALEYQFQMQEGENRKRSRYFYTQRQSYFVPNMSILHFILFLM